MNNAFADPGVIAVFEAYPKAVKAKLLRLRRLIFDTAARMPEVGRWKRRSNGASPAT